MEVPTLIHTFRYQLDFDIVDLSRDRFSFRTWMLVFDTPFRKNGYSVWAEGELSLIQPNITSVELRLWRGKLFWINYLMFTFWTLILSSLCLSIIFTDLILLKTGIMIALVFALWRYGLQASENHKRKLTEMIVGILGRIERYEYFEPETIS